MAPDDHQCERCGKYLATRSALNSHILTVHDKVSMEVKCKHCTEVFTNKAAMTSNFKRQFSKVAPSAENLALFRRFGHKIDANLKDDEALKELEKYKSTFGADINKKNIKMYVEAYSNRQDISSLLINMKCDALLVVGSKTSHIAAAEHMHTCMDKTRSSILKGRD